MYNSYKKCSSEIVKNANHKDKSIKPDLIALTCIVTKPKHFLWFSFQACTSILNIYHNKLHGHQGYERISYISTPDFFRFS